MAYTYQRTASGVEWIEDEVLTKEVKTALDAFTQTLIREGQKTHEVLEKQLLKAIQTVEGGQAVQNEDVTRAVLKHISRTFGDDALAKVVAKALATGDYLY